MRLFVAVWPDGAALDEIAALHRPELAGVRWTTRDQWHITLRFFGEVEDADPLVRALTSAVDRIPPVTAVMGPRVIRVGNMLWAPVEGLVEIASVVVGATSSLGSPPEDRPFRGHVTLARQRSRGRGGLGAVRSGQGHEFVGSWTVRSVDLVRSHLGSGGARYESIAELPLASAR
jgi:2'-5' RNA ligase